MCVYWASSEYIQFIPHWDSKLAFNFVKSILYIMQVLNKYNTLAILHCSSLRMWYNLTSFCFFALVSWRWIIFSKVQNCRVKVCQWGNNNQSPYCIPLQYTYTEWQYHMDMWKWVYSKTSDSQLLYCTDKTKYMTDPLCIKPWTHAPRLSVRYFVKPAFKAALYHTMIKLSLYMMPSICGEQQWCFISFLQHCTSEKHAVLCIAEL